MKFSKPSLASIHRRFMDLLEYTLSFLRTVPFVLTPCLVKLFRLCFSTSTFFSCWKYAYVKLGPKNGDRSNPSNYRPIALLICLSKAFESILNRKIQKHLFISDLLSDRQYGFRKGRSAGDLLSLLTDSWSSSLSRFGETFSVALDKSKAFDRVWHKSLLSKLPSFGFYPSLCSFISSFHSGHSISVVVDGHCSSPKPSVLSPTLFPLFISDLLSVTNFPIHSYADDSTLHFSTSFDRRPTLQDLQDSRLEAAERLTSDLPIGAEGTWYPLMPQKLSFFIYLLDIIFQTPIPYSSTKHSYHPPKHWTSSVYPLLKISTGNFTSLSLNQLNRSWSFCIVSGSSSPAHNWCPIKGLPRPRMGYASHVWGAPRTQLSLTEWSLKLFVSSVLLLSLTIFSLPNSAGKLPLYLSCIVIFTLTALLNLLTHASPLLRLRCTCFCTQAHPFTVQIPYARVNQHFHAFIHFTGKLWNDLPLSVFPPAYDLNSFRRRASQTSLLMNLVSFRTLLFFFQRSSE